MSATGLLSLLLLGRPVPEETSPDDAAVASMDPCSWLDDVLLWHLDEDGWD